MNSKKRSILIGAALLLLIQLVIAQAPVTPNREQQYKVLLDQCSETVNKVVEREQAYRQALMEIALHARTINLARFKARQALGDGLDKIMRERNEKLK